MTQTVHDVQQRLIGAEYSRASEVDAHNTMLRGHWAIHMNGALALQGFDVTAIVDGTVFKVIGFFGEWLH